jgi:MFS family permease
VTHAADRRPAAGETAPPTDAIFTRDFLSIWVASLSGFLSFYLIQQPALPLYVESIGGTARVIGWVGGAFSITTLLFRPMVGRAVDTVGRRLLVIVGGVVFVICAPLYAVVPGVGWLIALRLLHGAGMAFFTTSSTTYATDLAPAERRAELIGYFGIGNNVALGLGPLIGSLLLAAGLSYGDVFFIAAGVAVVIPAVMLPARESPHRKAKHDNWHWRTFINTRALAPAGLMLTVAFTYGALAYFMAVFVAQRGMAERAVAWYWAVYAGTLIVVRLFSGRLADRYGRAAAIVPGLLMVSAALFMMIAVHGYALLVLSALLFAAGFGFVYPALLAMTIDRVGATSRGTAMATFSVSFDFGIGVGAIAGGQFAGALGYATMFAIAGAAPLLGLAGYLWMLWRRRAGRMETA